jgi:hypothetical protein
MIQLSTVTVHHEGEREVLIATTPGKQKFADTPEDQDLFASKTLGSRVNESKVLFSVDFPVKRRLWITIMSLALALAFIMLMVYFVVNFGIAGRHPDKNSEKNFVDIESPLQDFTEDVIPFVQHWFDSLGIDEDKDTPLINKLTYSEDQCVKDFAALEFRLDDYQSYQTYFRQDSLMASAQTDEYVGPEDIEEYVRFADDSSPYRAQYKVLNQLFALKKFDASTGTCQFNVLSTVHCDMDPELALDVSYQVATMLNLYFELNGNFISRINVYYAEPFLQFSFGETLNTEQTRNFVCEVIETNCPETYALNGKMSREVCVERLNALPVVTNDSYVDGNSQGCRFLHAAFAASNEKHCAHLSFLPQEDPKGRIKCQTSHNISVTDLFDADDMALFNSYIVSKESFIGSDTSFKVDSSSAINSDDNGTVNGTKGNGDSWLGFPGPEYYYMEGSVTERSPCPAINTLANHGFIARDGFVGVSSLAIALEEVFGALAQDSIDLLDQMKANGLQTEVISNDDGETDEFFYLFDLNSHNQFEHDASFFRQDYYFEPFSLYDSELFNELVQVAQPDPFVDAEDVAIQHSNRILHSRKNNPEFLAGPTALFGFQREPALMFLFSRDENFRTILLSDLESFVGANKIPEGWTSRRERQLPVVSLASPIFDNYISFFAARSDQALNASLDELDETVATTRDFDDLSFDDLPPCNSKPPVEQDFARNFVLPRELLEGGKFTVLQPRSDWVTVHEFYFPASPPGQAYASVTFEFGMGVGGTYANCLQCMEAGAPGGCPDLRLVWGPGPEPFNWSDPASQQEAAMAFNSSLDPFCNTVGERQDSVRLEILDMCLDTEKSDDDFWYAKVRC